ncbi:hypothetical protein AT251_09855 [Enterovibrio nigricans]|nr:hypothetical protein AT251_09855 [Enterovibrio nigricans]
MIDGKHCNQPVRKSGLCERSFNTIGGSIVGAAVAGAFALSPIGVIVAGVFGGIVGWKIYNRDDGHNKEQ